MRTNKGEEDALKLYIITNCVYVFIQTDENGSLTSKLKPPKAYLRQSRVIMSQRL